MTPLVDLLQAWPGRFSRAGLLAALNGLEPPDATSIADTTLDDVIACRDEEAALQYLLESGEFAAVRAILEADPSLTGHRRTALRDQLDQRTAGRVRQVVERISLLEDKAKHAGTPLETDRETLTYVCQESWPEAERRVDAIEAGLRKRIDERRNELGSKLPAMSPAARRSVDLMLREGYLREVGYLLGHDVLESAGPVSVPPPPAWEWEANNPAEVLEWFLDPTQLHPPQFGVWREAASSPEAEQLLACFRSLATGGREAAGAFGEALETLLRPGSGPSEPPEAVPAPDGGYLVQIGNVFTDPEIAPFRPRETLRLFVADPDVVAVPESVRGLRGLTIAVGPSLERPATTGRSTCALLDARSLLRVVACPDRRSVGLARLLGRQWPLGAIGATYVGLNRLFDTALSPWTALSWLVDLAGLGGMTTAAVLAFETGYETRVLMCFLDMLSAPGGASARTGVPLSRWNEDEQFRAHVESAVLHGIRASDVGQAAFWASLLSVPPGEEMTLNDLIRNVALVSDDGLERASELEAGVAAMSGLPYLERTSETSYRLRDVGVLIALRGVAGPRLRAAVRRLAATTEQPSSMTAWAANRFALTEDWIEYERVRAERNDEAAIIAARNRLARPTQRLVELAAQAPADGLTDLAALLDELKYDFTEAFATIRLTVDALAPMHVAVDSRVVRILLHELLANSTEAITGAGRIDVTVRDESDGEVIVEVRDSGPGLSQEIARPERAFRADVTTHGAGRGSGLHIAQQLVKRYDGVLVFDRRSSNDPMFPGACIRLTLPSWIRPS